MITKKKKWYPGKPGPKPTGLTRTVPFYSMLSADESEYLERLQLDAQSSGKKLKAAQIVRSRTFRRGWQKELEDMRKQQGTIVKITNVD